MSGEREAALERELKQAILEIDHLRGGIKAYREYINTQNPYPMMRWEREEAKRDER